ncbi:MAG: hypothetical protein R3C52_11330 [Hyphomonadaceae bacterium]
MTHGKTAALAALLIAAACAPQEQTAAAAGDAVLFHDVRVLDFSGDAPEAREHMSVLVRGGTVETDAAVNSSGHQAPAGAPGDRRRRPHPAAGLVDMHVHIWDQAELGAYLSYGVTTVRNASGMPFLLEMRDAIDAGGMGRISWGRPSPVNCAAPAYSGAAGGDGSGGAGLRSAWRLR